MTTLTHLPIISVLEIEPERIAHNNKYNFRLTDWDKFRKTLEINLSGLLTVEEPTSIEAFHNQITNLDVAIKETIKEHIPLTKSCPYMKRWWTKNLTDLKKQKEHLVRGHVRGHLSQPISPIRNTGPSAAIPAYVPPHKHNPT